LEHAFEEGTMLARIRKAVVAGVGAGVAAAVSVIWKSGKVDGATISQAIGAFAAAAALIGWATWRAPNARA
jgi:high-affinity Fe2+/Pb2+ permease